MRLKDKVALVTGGGSGIGRATAAIFAREGARVVVSDVDAASMEETVEQIVEVGGEATGVTGDVSRSGDAEAMVRATVTAYGGIDILVNSAGITARNALPEGAPEEEVWDRVIDVNLKGTYLMCRYAVDDMEHAGGGSIINLASVMALVGYPTVLVGGFNPYGPSKGGVLQFTRGLAVEYAAKKIRVNCICPGFVVTNLTRDLSADRELSEQLKKRHPMGRFGRPEEIAYAALYLASDESSFVTGAPLVVDGGYTAQ